MLRGEGRDAQARERKNLISFLEPDDEPEDAFTRIAVKELNVNYCIGGGEPYQIRYIYMSHCLSSKYPP